MKITRGGGRGRFSLSFGGFDGNTLSCKVPEQLRESEVVNCKRMQRLMRWLGLQGAVPGPNTSRPHLQHLVYPYLLGPLCIDRPNLAWSSDTTYVPMARGFSTW